MTEKNNDLEQGVDIWYSLVMCPADVLPEDLKEEAIEAACGYHFVASDRVKVRPVNDSTLSSDPFAKPPLHIVFSVITFRDNAEMALLEAIEADRKYAQDEWGLPRNEAHCRYTERMLKNLVLIEEIVREGQVEPLTESVRAVMPDEFVDNGRQTLKEGVEYWTHKYGGLRYS